MACRGTALLTLHDVGGDGDNFFLRVKTGMSVLGCCSLLSGSSRPHQVENCPDQGEGEEISVRTDRTNEIYGPKFQPGPTGSYFSTHSLP
jgi:hypothetical protein